MKLRTYSSGIFFLSECFAPKTHLFRRDLSAGAVQRSYTPGDASRHRGKVLPQRAGTSIETPIVLRKIRVFAVLVALRWQCFCFNRFVGASICARFNVCNADFIVGTPLVVTFRDESSSCKLCLPCLVGTCTTLCACTLHDVLRSRCFAVVLSCPSHTPSFSMWTSVRVRVGVLVLFSRNTLRSTALPTSLPW